jgi:hypothetical protein
MLKAREKALLAALRLACSIVYFSVGVLLIFFSQRSGNLVLIYNFYRCLRFYHADICQTGCQLFCGKLSNACQLGSESLQ